MTFKFDNPKANNSVTSLKVLFDDKKYYYDFILPFLYMTNDKIFFSDIYNNHALYGLVDSNFNVILPKNEFIVDVTITNNKQQKMLDFAADAYSGLKRYLENACTIGKVDRNGLYGNIRPYKSYSDPNILVDSVQSVVANDFKEFITSEVALNSKIKDHDTFNKEFLNFIKNRIASNMAISKSEIILSNFFISYCNGLMLDFADEKTCDIDEIKYQKYLSNKDFIGFKDTCKRFGFYIDANMPWRIMLDVNSPAMYNIGNHIGYLYKNNIFNLDDLFDKRYNRVYLDEIKHLKNFFYNSYKYFLIDNLYYEDDYSKLAGNRIKNRKLYKRDVLSKEQYLSHFDDMYWLRIYAYVRNYETSRGLTQQEFENIVREGIRFIKVNKQDEALKYINNYFKSINNVDFNLTTRTTSDNIKAPTFSSIPKIVF